MAFFQEVATALFDKEKLNNEHKGLANSNANSFRTQLVMPSGPDAIPNFKDWMVSFTSSGVGPEVLNLTKYYITDTSTFTGPERDSYPISKTDRQNV